MDLAVRQKDWVKWGKKRIEEISLGDIIVILRDVTQRRQNVTIRGSFTRCSSGVFKDACMFDNHDVVVRMMTNKRDDRTWPTAAKERHTRFDLYKNPVEPELMYCFGQVFLEKCGTGGLEGFRGDFSLTNGHTKCCRLS